MAKTRKRNTGETPREFVGASQADTAPASPQPEPGIAAAFEGPTSEEAERIGEPQSGDAWAPQSTGDTTAAASDRDRIAARAYEIYLERGGSGGDSMEDWLAAEREFASRTRHQGNSPE
ncbi:MAG: DUF2934 domain-containing protein [Acidobacteriota bacterium]|nr:DUF2934 domain-containing protein [Acidobacteriota bacterium]MDQ3418469.1 DUF2934 domain-containing protein [Acidobacteriota bacterium]